MMGSLLPARWAASLAPLLRTPGARGAALVGLAACLSRCSLSDFDSLSSGLNLNGNLPDGGAGASFEPDASTDTNTGGTGGEGGSAGQGNAGSSGSSGSGNLPDGGPGEDPDAGPTGPQNLILDPGFEQGSMRWTSVGNVVLSLSTDDPHAGDSCLLVTGRDDFVYEGPGYDLLGTVELDASYTATVWVRLKSPSQVASLTFKGRCVGETDETALYSNITSVRSTAALGWQQLSGSFTTRACELTGATLFIQSPDIGEEFYIDDASLYRTSP